MSEYVLRFKQIDPSELLPEAMVIQQHPDAPFLGPGDRPEPYRTLYLAAARMQPVYAREQVRGPLIVTTPRGRGLLWRWWPGEVGVVLFHAATDGNGMALDEHITFFRGSECEAIALDLTQIVTNPPRWR
ncbi:MAG: hypothetical protein ACYDER_07880 [Ktedonobacteraceae bacterium]